MTPSQAAHLEKTGRQDLSCRKTEMYKLLNEGKDMRYERWLAKEQQEARLIEENL